MCVCVCMYVCMCWNLLYRFTTGAQYQRYLTHAYNVVLLRMHAMYIIQRIYIYIYICIYVYIYIYIYIHTYIHTVTVVVDNNTWNNTHIATVGAILALPEWEAWTLMRRFDIDYVMVCVCVCMYVCVYVCVYIYIYIYMYILCMYEWSMDLNEQIRY